MTTMIRDRIEAHSGAVQFIGVVLAHRCHLQGEVHSSE